MSDEVKSENLKIATQAILDKMWREWDVNDKLPKETRERFDVRFTAQAERYAASCLKALGLS